MKGDGEAPTLIKKVGPGQTVKVRAGQWLIESQGEVHHAVNNGDIPIVIFASTLFRTGAAAAIPD
jgi:quercetin dioxygenase-like cupin family protein